MNQINRDLQNNIIGKWYKQKQEIGENYSREHCEKVLLSFKDYPKLKGTAQTYNRKLNSFLTKTLNEFNIKQSLK